MVTGKTKHDSPCSDWSYGIKAVQKDFTSAIWIRLKSYKYEEQRTNPQDSEMYLGTAVSWYHVGKRGVNII